MIFNSLSRHDPKRIALRDESRAITYRDLLEQIDIRAGMLKDVRTLALMLDNSVDWILWDLAALRAGIPCVPLPPFFIETQVQHALMNAGVSHVLYPDGLHETKLEAQIIPPGTAKITYTSGSTGAPKGVCLSRKAMEDVASSIVEMLGKDMAGIHLCVLPLGILLENVAGVYAALLAGATVELRSLRNFGYCHGQLFEQIKNAHATSVILVPELLRILTAQVSAKGKLNDLRYVAVGGAKISPDMITSARDLGIPAYEGYGLSECASVVAMNVPGDDKVGSAGKLLPYVSADSIDNEIVIRTPGFLGYVGASKPEIFPTGDLGTIDADGFLHVTGRKKNVLITSFGRNISPEWVEAELLGRPEIAQAFVYGDHQSMLSALLVPTLSVAAVEKAVKAVNQALPDYARIGDYRIVSPFTKENGLLTGNGRPRRDMIFHHYQSITEKEKDHEFLRQAG